MEVKRGGRGRGVSGFRGRGRRVDEELSGFVGGRFWEFDFIFVVEKVAVFFFC